MIARGRVELTLWALALALAVMAGARARLERVGASDLPPWTPAPLVVRRTSVASLSAMSQHIVARDPFRLDRRPSSIAYTPIVDGASPQPPRPPKPPLAVTGIVGGPPWEALMEGIPGREGGVLVRRGDRFGDSTARLTVRRIAKDTVIVVGVDTTWTLTVRRAWQ
jgi:hypothetical protein